MQQQISALQPRVRAISSSPLAPNTSGAQIARILETIAQSTPREDALRFVHIAPDASGWRVSVRAARPSAPDMTSEYSVPR